MVSCTLQASATHKTYCRTTSESETDSSGLERSDRSTHSLHSKLSTSKACFLLCFDVWLQVDCSNLIALSTFFCNSSVIITCFSVCSFSLFQTSRKSHNMRYKLTRLPFHYNGRHYALSPNVGEPLQRDVSAFDIIPTSRH